MPLPSGLVRGRALRHSLPDGPLLHYAVYGVRVPIRREPPSFDNISLHRICAVSMAVPIVRAFEDYHQPERRVDSLRVYASAAKALGWRLRSCQGARASLRCVWRTVWFDRNLSSVITAGGSARLKSEDRGRAARLEANRLAGCTGSRPANGHAECRLEATPGHIDWFSRFCAAPCECHWPGGE